MIPSLSPVTTKLKAKEKDHSLFSERCKTHSLVMLNTVMDFRWGSHSFNARLFIGELSKACSLDWAERETISARVPRESYRCSRLESLSPSGTDVSPDRCSPRFCPRIFSRREFHCVSKWRIWRYRASILVSRSSSPSVRRASPDVEELDFHWVCNPRGQVCRSSFRWSLEWDEGERPIEWDNRVSLGTCWTSRERSTVVWSRSFVTHSFGELRIEVGKTFVGCPLIEQHLRGGIRDQLRRLTRIELKVMLIGIVILQF